MKQEIQEIVKSTFTYNPDTGEIRRIKNGKLYNKLNDQGYVRIGIHSKEEKRTITIKGQQVAWLLYYGIVLESDKEIDHKDRDRSNNKISNLREATVSRNHSNRPKQLNNTSGYKGVSWFKYCNRWRADIRQYGHQIFLGTFKNKIDAAKAYDKKAKELFGDFAYLNFP